MDQYPTYIPNVVVRTKTNGCFPGSDLYPRTPTVSTRRNLPLYHSSSDECSGIGIDSVSTENDWSSGGMDQEYLAGWGGEWQEYGGVWMLWLCQWIIVVVLVLGLAIHGVLGSGGCGGCWVVFWFD